MNTDGYQEEDEATGIALQWVPEENLSWLPDYFVLIKKDAEIVEGYVHTEAQLKSLLQLHSENTLSHFYRS